MITAPIDPVRLAAARELIATGSGRAPDRDDSLERVRYGVYADRATLEQADSDARHLARIRAVAVSRSSPVFARESALAVHGIPFGVAPDLVFTTGDVRTARRKAGVQHATVELDPRDLTVVDDLLACTPAYALADVARRREPVVSVAALDWALRQGQATKDDVLAALSRQSVRGRRAAQWAIEFADAASESVGESCSRVRVHELGFAPPELQVWVVGRSGKRYRVDMLFRRPGRRALAGEFDGMSKYGILAAQAGTTGAQALAREKAREDDLRFEVDVARWIWADVLQPARLERVLSAHDVPRIRRPSIAATRAV